MAEQPERVKQALEHPCPRCHAPAGIGCARPSGSMLPSHTVHAAREGIVDTMREDTGPPSVIRTNAGRTIWRDAMRALRERGDVTPWNTRILLSAVRWTEEHEAALERAADAPEVIGSTGQSVANPQFKVASTAQARALQAFMVLLLPPAARVATAASGSDPGETGDEFDDLDRAAASGRRSRSG